MPVQRLYREPMTNWLESYQQAHPNAAYPEFCIGAYHRLNPTFCKLRSKNFSELEAIGGYTGRFLLIENPRRNGELVPDQNIIQFYKASRKFHNDRARNVVAQLKTIPYDFPVVRRPSRLNPDGSVNIVTYRFLEPCRGDDAVDLAQTDLRNSIAGMQRKDELLDQCRDISAVDTRIAEIIREHNL